jgi:hypothetical protein
MAKRIYCLFFTLLMTLGSSSYATEQKGPQATPKNNIAIQRPILFAAFAAGVAGGVFGFCTGVKEIWGYRPVADSWLNALKLVGHPFLCVAGAVMKGLIFGTLSSLVVLGAGAGAEMALCRD